MLPVFKLWDSLMALSVPPRTEGSRREGDCSATSRAALYRPLDCLDAPGSLG